MSTEEIKEYIGTQLKALTSIASPTGFTKNATDYLMKQLEAMGYAPQLSNKGNVSVEIGGEGAPLVLAAHVDTLGAMVRSIKDNGRLRPTTIGGHQWSTCNLTATIKTSTLRYVQIGTSMSFFLFHYRIKLPI